MLCGTALAQQAPDAGQILQQQQQVAPPLPRTGAAIDIQSPAPAATLPGGQQVTLQSVSLRGVSVFSEADLLAVLGAVAGQSYDLAGLRGLASRVSDHYRGNGYPFARAFLPPQPLTDGQLIIEVVEGRYGQVTAEGDGAESAQRFLAPLQAGAVIESSTLERATLVLDDQPGFKAAPIIRPGQELGTGDLNVRVSRERLVSSDVGLDNHGNRYTGQYRARLNVQADSPFLFGDQVQLRSLVSDEGMWLGSLNYSAPLGASGWRANVGYAHTYYQLGKDFANLDARGTAKVNTAGISYPLIRSQKTNLTLAASWQHKRLNDRQDSSHSSNDKHSDSWPLVMQFDRRDGFAGGGISYGTLAFTSGRLKLDAALEATDIASNTDTRGSFQKWNLDIARLQATPVANLSFFARASAQRAGKNLDSSESFSLGGANGVRAYPQGEGIGDEGWLIQLEARYQMGFFSPYAFYDAGKIRVNADPGRINPEVTSNVRRLAGSGMGVRYGTGPWIVDAALAWRTQGGQPQSDTQDRDVRLWLTGTYRF